jgi:hypothetical protein
MGSLLDVKQLGHEVDHFRLVPRLRMMGAVPVLLLYGFMAWAGTSSHLYFFRRFIPNSGCCIKTAVENI